jgi:hypothetical protein
MCFEKLELFPRKLIQSSKLQSASTASVAQGSGSVVFFPRTYYVPEAIVNCMHQNLRTRIQS